MSFIKRSDTNNIFSDYNSQQKRQIDPFYNRMINYLNQKELNYSLTDLASLNISPLQQTKANSTVPPNDVNINLNNEPVC